MTNEISAEIARVGMADGYGETGGVSVECSGESVTLRDEATAWTGLATEALRRLRALPNDAGLEDFWAAFPEDAE